MFHPAYLAAATAHMTILLRYSVACGSVILALLLSLLARPLIEPNPFLLFFAAVALSAWAGGLKPGLLATSLAALASDYFFLLPRDAWSLAGIDLERVSGFTLVALIICVLSESRIRGAARLRASDERTRASLKAALDGIITIDATGRVAEFNPAAEEIFAYTRVEAVGRELADLIVPPAVRDAHRRGLARCVATGQGPILGKRIEMTAVRADGTEFPVERAITSIVSDGRGRSN